MRASELTAINQEIEQTNDGVSRSLYWLFMIPRLTLAVIRIVILFVVGYGVFRGAYTLTDFTLIITLIILFETFLVDSVDFFKNFTKDFSDIESLWNTVDNGPTIEDYTTGKPYTKTQQDIVLDRVQYAYHDTVVFEDFSLAIQQ